MKENLKLHLSSDHIINCIFFKLEKKCLFILFLLIKLKTTEKIDIFFFLLFAYLNFERIFLFKNFHNV